MRAALLTPHARPALLALLAVVTLSRAALAAPAPRREPPSLAERYRDSAERLIGAAMTSDHAWLRLSQLCDGIGHRLSGSASLDRAIEWAAGAMREDGLERVRLQPVKVPHWVRGAERAEMVEPGPQKLSMLGLGRSPATPVGGVTAEVVVVGSFAEMDALPDGAIRGRIVLFDVPYTKYSETVKHRSDGPRKAARRGAVAALVRSVGPVSLRTPHTGSMSDSLPTVPGAAVSIEDAMMLRRLTARGERVRVKLEMEAKTLPDARSANVLGEIRGRERPEEVVVIGAHLDSWDVGQGAHDDGGGCVISMEALRLMKKLGLRPRRTLRVVFWTNEENGAKGAQAYADSLAKKERHVAALESDGGVETPVGFGFSIRRVAGDTADVARTARMLEKMRAIAPLFSGLGADAFTPDGGGVDIGPLMKLGVPGIGHKTTMAHYFDWHHTPADMLDKVDPIELKKNVAAMAVMAFVLADMPETLAEMAPASAPARPAAPANPR